MTQIPSPLFYQRIVALDRQRHAGLKLQPAADLAFTATAPAVPLLSSEFADAAREYPIVFVRDPEQLATPVVLTGVPAGPNLYLDAAGQWMARYIPAYVRRYPFALARTGSDQFTVCIDESCPALQRSEGSDLFETSGEPSPLLLRVSQHLHAFEQQSQLTHAFMRRVDAAGLLIESGAKADSADGHRIDLRGFWIVDESRLRALPEATLKAWLESGDLGLIYAHLLSLGNLLELLRRQPSAATQSIL